MNKDTRRAYDREWRAKNPDKIRAYRLKHAEKMKVWQANYLQKVKGTLKYKEYRRELDIKRREKHPEKYYARAQTQKLEKQPCQECNTFPVHAHHEDYSKPLDVLWLCPEHHNKRHQTIKI